MITDETGLHSVLLPTWRQVKGQKSVRVMDRGVCIGEAELNRLKSPWN